MQMQPSMNVGPAAAAASPPTDNFTLPPSTATPSVLLEATGLVKHYPKVKAVDGVSLQLYAGTCLGLLGPNGAGKSTTIEMLEGSLPAPFLNGAISCRCSTCSRPSPLGK